jgi:GTP-binding protein
MPPDPEADPVKDVKVIVSELKKYSPELAKKPRWLVLNKIDALPDDEADARCKGIVRRLRWKGPVYRISGLAHLGTDRLCQDIMKLIEEMAEQERQAALDEEAST